MNAFTYESFKLDMMESVEDFINNTDYKILWISDSSFLLSNGKKNIFFYLEAMNLYSTISNIDDSDKIAIYEIFIKENIIDSYPKNVNNLSYVEYNKFEVKNVLKMLRTILYEYIS